MNRFSKLGIPGSRGVSSIRGNFSKLTLNRNMVLLGRIRLAQDRLDEALKFASKALAFRMECIGERLKVVNSLYQVADLLHKGDNTGISM